MEFISLKHTYKPRNSIFLQPNPLSFSQSHNNFFSILLNKCCYFSWHLFRQKNVEFGNLVLKNHSVINAISESVTAFMAVILNDILGLGSQEMVMGNTLLIRYAMKKHDLVQDPLSFWLNHELANEDDRELVSGGNNLKHYKGKNIRSVIHMHQATGILGSLILTVLRGLFTPFLMVTEADYYPP